MTLRPIGGLLYEVLRILRAIGVDLANIMRERHYSYIGVAAPASPAGAAANGSAGSAVPWGNAAGLPGPGIDPEELHGHEEAIADCSEAIRLDPDHTGAYLGRCHAKSELGRHEDAVEDYDHAVRLDPDPVAA